jgi:hypothetical protein
MESDHALRVWAGFFNRFGTGLPLPPTRRGEQVDG